MGRAVNLRGALVAAILGLTLLGGASAAIADCGDANGDNQVTALDALVVLKGAVGLEGDCIGNCDCDLDADRELTAGDALQTLRAAVGADSDGCGFYDECFYDEDCDDGQECGTDPSWSCDAACVPEP
jgi:hypothetical protein